MQDLRDLQYWRNAGNPLYWLLTVEPERGMQDVISILREIDPRAIMQSWDAVNGLVDVDSGSGQKKDLLQTLKELCADSQAPETVLFVHMAHVAVKPPPIIQMIRNSVTPLKSKGKAVFFLAPDSTGIPPDIARLLKQVEHVLPTPEHLRSILNRTLHNAFGEEVEAQEEITPESRELAVQVGKGLSAYEFETATAISIAKFGRLEPSILSAQKEDMIRASGSLELIKSAESLDDLVGLEFAKNQSRRMLQKISDPNINLRPGATVMFGVWGCGKTEFYKRLGFSQGLPVIEWRLGNVKGSLVGESEAKMKRDMQIIRAIGRCLVIIDEIEKMIAGGVKNGGRSDGGVMMNIMADLMKFLADKDKECFIGCTCNDIRDLTDTGLFRAGRVDMSFFVDLPDDLQKASLWDFFKEKFGVDGEVPDDTGWTGAEIEQCCRNAAVCDYSIKEAGRTIVPMIVSAKEAVESLRDEAARRFLDANIGGPYKRPAEVKGGGGSRRMRVPTKG